jgi:hypothetical protein
MPMILCDYSNNLWTAVRELGYSGADVARLLGVTNSCLTRFVASGRKPDADDLIKNLWTFCTASRRTNPTNWLLNYLRISRTSCGTDHFSSQFSTRRSGTRENSRTFADTSVKFRARAWAAINRSFPPMGCPAWFKSALIFP